MPRAKGGEGVVCLAGVLDGRACGEPAGGAIVGLDAVLEEEGGGFGGGAEGAVWADEFLGFLGDEAADGVSEDWFLVLEEVCS